MGECEHAGDNANESRDEPIDRTRNEAATRQSGL